jgi:hypothetical protein
MRNLERDRPALTAAEVDDLVRLARGYAVKIRALPDDLVGHPNTNWPIPHIHFGDAEVHVPVPPGYAQPP